MTTSTTSSSSDLPLEEQIKIAAEELRFKTAAFKAQMSERIQGLGHDLEKLSHDTKVMKHDFQNQLKQAVQHADKTIGALGELDTDEDEY
jgi:hypothetical protein